jgi:nucleotide-binding universal stress UspA family protein
MPGSHATSPDRGPTLVVGYDGSPESRAALETAAHAAGPTGKVYVVIAFEEPPGWMGDARRDVALNEAEAPGRELIAGLERHEVPGLRSTSWQAEHLPGPPADAILRVADVRGAAEILIGSRGRGRTQAVLGSVSHDVLHRADRPVRVITHRAAERLAQQHATTVP